jgi:hypothetical protein
MVHYLLLYSSDEYSLSSSSGPSSGRACLLDRTGKLDEVAVEVGAEVEEAEVDAAPFSLASKYLATLKGTFIDLISLIFRLTHPVSLHRIPSHPI